MNKKQEIKNRINLINKGEIPEGYKKEHGYIIPINWQISHFNKIFDRIIQKNDIKCDNVLTISAQYGLINQQEFFKKNIASTDTSSYFLLHKGDFAYNKSYSARYPFGTIKRLRHYTQGIVSPLYICFKMKDKVADSNYLEQYFDANKFNSEILAIAQEGARNHGLLNMGIDDFFNCRIINPPLQEQEKIAEILSCCDKVIELKEKLLKEENNKKRIILNKIFNNKKKDIKLSKIALIIMGQSPDSKYYNANEQGLPLIQGNADCVNRLTKPRFWTSDVTKECKVGDIIMSVRAPAGTISRAMHNACIGRGVCAIRAKTNSELLYQYLISLENKWRRITQGSTFEAINSKEIANILIPDINKKEQEKYSEILRNCDISISLYEQELEQYKQLKKSLSQLLLTGIVRVNEV